MSHIYTYPLLVPTLRWPPLADQLRDVTWFVSPRSQSSDTVDVVAFHTYTADSNATASIFYDDQSTKLR